MIETAPEVRRSRWVGRGSPGVLGYVLAVLASAVLLGPIILVDSLVRDGTSFSGQPGDLLVTAVAMAVFVPFFALFYGWPAALVGCALVHVICLGVREQSVHVATAGLAGVAAGFAYAYLFDDFGGSFWLDLGAATAAGRALVIPLARRRQA